MDKIRGDLTQRNKHEITQMQPWMRKCKEGGIEACGAVEQEVQIDSTGQFLRFFLSSQQILDTKHSSHHLRGTYLIYSHLGGHVEKLRCSGHVDGICFVDRRDLCD